MGRKLEVQSRNELESLKFAHGNGKSVDKIGKKPNFFDESFLANDVGTTRHSHTRRQL